MCKSGENGLNRIKQRIWSYLSPIGVPSFIYLTIKIYYKVKVSLVAQIDSSKPSILSCPFSLDFYMLDIYQIFIWKVFKNFPFQFILTPSRAQRVGFLCKLCDPYWQFQTGVYRCDSRNIQQSLYKLLIYFPDKAFHGLLFHGRLGQNGSFFSCSDASCFPKPVFAIYNLFSNFSQL